MQLRIARMPVDQGSEVSYAESDGIAERPHRGPRLRDSVPRQIGGPVERAEDIRRRALLRRNGPGRLQL